MNKAGVYYRFFFLTKCLSFRTAKLISIVVSESVVWYPIEPVEFFHQFLFVGFREFHHIAGGKFIRVIGYSFVNIPGRDPVYLCHIGIHKHKLSPPGNE
jgi:hypothetical protein